MFSKAKLLRFNEVHNATPSPADYTILDNSHVAGVALFKAERFAELSSPASSDVSSHHSSSCNVSVFRTPNLPPKRKPKTKIAANIKPIELFQSEDTLDALKEKIVECNNKDQYINELMEQVEEMKQHLSSCNSELSDLNLENSRLAETLVNLNADKEFLLNDQKTHLSNVNLKLLTTYNIHNKIGDVKSINCENTNDLKTLLENVGILDDLLESYKIINDRNTIKLEEKEQQLLHLENKYLDLYKEHTVEIAKIRETYETQIEKFQLKQNQREEDFVKELKLKSEFIEDTENQLNKLQEKYKIEKQQLLEENEAKILQLRGNFKEASMLADIQTEEKCKAIERNWQLKLEQSKDEADAILKECQAIAEYNIIQSEIEKNQLIYDFTEHKNVSQLLKENYDKLKHDFNCLSNQYKNLTDNVTDIKKSQAHTLSELEISKNVIGQMNKDKHKYEITIMKAHVLIDTLKNRLMNSDNDVEQLKIELEDTEASKIEYEDKCNQVEDELRTVLKLFDNVNKEIKAARKENEENARQIEENLLLKVDNFRKEADSKTAVLNHELDLTKSKLNDALEHLVEQQTLYVEAQKVIESSLKQIDAFETCTKCTENEDKYNAVQKKLHKLEGENQDLLKKIEEQESLIGPFREQLIEYEAEHRALMNQKYNAEQEAKEMGLKYAQLIGHQNQNQKIRHLIDLKKKIYELNENIKELETKNRQQARTIEKLKKEFTITPKLAKKKIYDDKENISNNTPNRNLYKVFDNISKEEKH